MGINGKVKAVFLDRDGVINKAVVVDWKPYPPASVNELIIIDGVKEGLKILKKLGFLLIIVTNQPDVARGKTPLENVEAINKYLKNNLPIDDIYCCLHDENDHCSCRKPEPGMILSASEKWNIDLTKSYMVGDRWRDIQAGKSATVKTILINYNYNEKFVEPDFMCYSFEDVTNTILSNHLNKKI